MWIMVINFKWKVFPCTDFNGIDLVLLSEPEQTPPLQKRIIRQTMHIKCPIDCGIIVVRGLQGSFLFRKRLGLAAQEVRGTENMMED